MAQPVIVQDATLRQFARSLAGVFSLPQWKYFVIVLLGLLHGDAAHALSGILRQVAIRATVSGLSRFLKSAPWSVAALTAARASGTRRRCGNSWRFGGRPCRRGKATTTIVRSPGCWL